MKICWDNIENLYITIHGNLRDNKGETYDLFICLECNEDFLSRKGREASFYNTYANKISFADKVRRNKDNPDILETACTYCNDWFISTRINISTRAKRINDDLSRLYCSDKCKKECSIYWKTNTSKDYQLVTSREVQPELRQLVFERDNWTCQKCNLHKNKLKVGLHCHHIKGIRWEPIESADKDKCITYCKNCHEETHQIPGCRKVDMKCR